MFTTTCMYECDDAMTFMTLEASPQMAAGRPQAPIMQPTPDPPKFSRSVAAATQPQTNKLFYVIFLPIVFS